MEVFGAPAPDLPGQAVGDPGHLRQVLNNLLSNAAKFTARGEIQLSARPLFTGGKGFTLEVEVRDTGIGIPVSAQPHIFDVFYQGDGSITRHYGGSGLGLAIVQRLLAEMGGRIVLESTVGAGSCFRFRLPLEVARAGLVSGIEPAAAGSMPAAVCVRIGHPGVRQVIETQLRHWGIAIHHHDLDDRPASGPTGRMPCLLDYESLSPGPDGVDDLVGLLGTADGDDPAVIVLVPIHRLAELDAAPHTAHLKWLHRPVRLCQLRDTLLEQDRADTPVSDTTVQGGLGATILLVEDNPTNQLVMTELLTGLGLRVVHAEDGRHALARVMAEHPDLVLMDLHMPDMDGYQATAGIRGWEAENRPGQRMPIVALTADTLPQVRERCLAAGMDGYLLKPLLRADLLALLDHWLGQGWTPGTAARRQAPAPDASIAPDACLDMEIVQDLRDNVSVEAFARIVGKYFDVANGLLEQIRRNLARAAADDLAETLHQLKGSSATFGSSKLPPLCKTLELAARAGDFATVQARLPELTDELERLRQAFAALGEVSG
ncbi:MAG: ATP-binding protein [Gallionellaceae bacterium]|nr:ATP-binding protein [Gallionellaceae bacterium]